MKIVLQLGRDWNTPTQEKEGRVESRVFHSTLIRACVIAFASRANARLIPPPHKLPNSWGALSRRGLFAVHCTHSQRNMEKSAPKPNSGWLSKNLFMKCFSHLEIPRATQPQLPRLDINQHLGPCWLTAETTAWKINLSFACWVSFRFVSESKWIRTLLRSWEAFL